MPFTFAHPAIILPLKKSKRFCSTALIAGSIVPDFEFFFQLREVENIGHRWHGIFLFDLPLALFFCFIFRNLLRNALVINLPESIRNRVAVVLDFDWKNSLVVSGDKNGVVAFWDLNAGRHVAKMQAHGKGVGSCRLYSDNVD